MKPKSRKAGSDRKSDVLMMEDPPFVIDGHPIVVVMPPEEIADDGEVRMGCSALDGHFPAFRR